MNPNNINTQLWLETYFSYMNLRMKIKKSPKSMHIPNYILEHHLSTIWNVVGVTRLKWQKTSLFDPNMTPARKTNVLNSSAFHAQSFRKTHQNIDVV